MRKISWGRWLAGISSMVMVSPALAQTARTESGAGELPPVIITPPEARPPKRVARPKPAQNRGTRSTTAARSNQPAASASGVTPGASFDGAAALQPTAASAKRISGAEVNAVPFLRPGEALEVVPGLIVTQHSGEGKANQYFLRGFNLDHGTDLSIKVDGMPVNMPNSWPRAGLRRYQLSDP